MWFNALWVQQAMGQSVKGTTKGGLWLYWRLHVLVQVFWAQKIVRQCSMSIGTCELMSTARC